MKAKVLFILIIAITLGCKKKNNYVETINTVRFTSMNSPVSSDLNSVCFISSTEGFVGGVNGKVYKTSDGGNSWTDISLASSETVNKVLFRTSQKGYLATNYGIYVTTNGGTTWTQKHLDGTKDIYFVNNNIGYATQSANSSQGDAEVFKTYDGGNTWSVCNFHRMYMDLHAVCFINQDTGYIAGDDATLLETKDGGFSWQDYVIGTKWRNRGYSDKIYDLYFTGYRNGYVVGNNGYLNWITPFANYPGTSQITPMIADYDYPLSAVAFRGSKGVAVGENSVLMPDPALGSDLYSWSFYLGPDATTLPYEYYDAAFASDDTYYAVGKDGVITQFQYPN